MRYAILFVFGLITLGACSSGGSSGGNNNSGGEKCVLDYLDTTGGTTCKASVVCESQNKYQFICDASTGGGWDCHCEKNDQTVGQPFVTGDCKATQDGYLSVIRNDCGWWDLQL